MEKSEAKKMKRNETKGRVLRLVDAKITKLTLKVSEVFKCSQLSSEFVNKGPNNDYGITIFLLYSRFIMTWYI